jgi:hypothetical protein
MTDETLSPDHELANAYLDGHADAQERARVEASPELLALVAYYQALRVRVGAVPPPSAAAREASIQAALAAVPLVAPPPNVVPLGRRRWSTALTAAAAVVLLGVAGVAVSKAIGGSDSVSTAGDSLAAQEAIGGKVSPDTAAGVAPAGVAASEITGGTPEPNAIRPEISSIDGGASGVPALNTPAEVRSLRMPDVAVVPNIVFDCPLSSTQIIEAEITWQGQSAVAVRDTVSGVITVLSPDCAELVSVQPLP